MTLSPDGTMLVTFCNVGAARIWDTREFKLIQKLRDTEVYSKLLMFIYNINLIYALYAIFRKRILMNFLSENSFTIKHVLLLVAS